MQMRVSISIILLVVFSCKSRLSSETTTLDLSNQNLTTIPDSVFSLVNLRVLYLGNSFTLYPPLSALQQEGPSGSHMNKIIQSSDEIGRLQNLRVLNLTAVDLRSLPKGMIKLEHLDTLDVSFNLHFTVSNELTTLEKMHSLKYLNIVGTKSDQATIDHLRKLLPNTKIVTELKEVLEEIPE